MKKLILIQLNELNFDLIKKYPKKFKNFNYLIENGLLKISEQNMNFLNHGYSGYQFTLAKLLQIIKFLGWGMLLILNLSRFMKKLRKKDFQ